MTGPWYITAQAVREYQQIVGSADFDAAAKELGGWCEQARLAKDEGHRQIYRVRIDRGGKRYRLELTVSLSQREEGDRPQLVRVRNKGIETPHGRNR